MKLTNKEINRINREGLTFTSAQGQNFTIIEYIDCNNCTIKFEDGTVLKNTIYKNLKKGSITNPYYKKICGVGFIGEGKYKSKQSEKSTLYYTTWINMIKRCYDEKYHKKQPTYKDVIVCEEWHNFQNFAKWFEENYVEGFHLDKDILVKNNKIYSPETCCFIPREINNLFLLRKQERGKYPIGVKKNFNKYEVVVSKYKKQYYIGLFETPEEAFQVYKEVKEKYIKELAEKWKELIPSIVYQALYNYKVEIVD